MAAEFEQQLGEPTAYSHLGFEERLAVTRLSRFVCKIREQCLLNPILRNSHLVNAYVGTAKKTIYAVSVPLDKFPPNDVHISQNDLEFSALSKYK